MSHAVRKFVDDARLVLLPGECEGERRLAKCNARADELDGDGTSIIYCIPLTTDHLQPHRSMKQNSKQPTMQHSEIDTHVELK